MADIAEMWRDVHVHGAYSIADTWMAAGAAICRRPIDFKKGLYSERVLFFIRLFCNFEKRPGNFGRSRLGIVAAPFCKDVDGG